MAASIETLELKQKGVPAGSMTANFDLPAPDRPLAWKGDRPLTGADFVGTKFWSWPSPDIGGGGQIPAI